MAEGRTAAPSPGRRAAAGTANGGQIYSDSKIPWWVATTTLAFHNTAMRCVPLGTG